MACEFPVAVKAKLMLTAIHCLLFYLQYRRHHPLFRHLPNLTKHNIVLGSAHWLHCENMTSFIKPEVYNVLHCRQWGLSYDRS